MKATDTHHLYDILDAIHKIEKYYTTDSADELRWNMMLRQMQIIGEAVNKLSEATKQQTPEVPWSKIVATRHVLVHAYDDIHIPKIQHDIQSLKAAVTALLKKLDPNEELK
ncbi:MAG: DUF86 domain-containing protein [Pseudomonadota bacterium]|nr:DUF86 domain-containing protein [Pseudomonadota bacterium]MDE3038700.1 DUF86 domain-containing protein [Pseudomonadota bacterium]